MKVYYLGETISFYAKSLFSTTPSKKTLSKEALLKKFEDKIESLSSLEVHKSYEEAVNSMLFKPGFTKATEEYTPIYNLNVNNVLKESKKLKVSKSDVESVERIEFYGNFPRKAIEFNQQQENNCTIL